MHLPLVSFAAKSSSNNTSPASQDTSTKIFIYKYNIIYPWTPTSSTIPTCPNFLILSIFQHSSLLDSHVPSRRTCTPNHGKSADAQWCPLTPQRSWKNQIFLHSASAHLYRSIIFENKESLVIWSFLEPLAISFQHLSLAQSQESWMQQQMKSADLPIPSFFKRCQPTNALDVIKRSCTSSSKFTEHTRLI